MKYYDINDVEIPEEDIDYSLGRVELESKFIAHHDAVPAQPEKNHYEVSKFYFQDGTSYEVTSQDDPHIKAVEPEKGIFEYVDQGEGKEIRGIDLKTVTDEKATEAKEAYDETEEFYRWIPYTEEELAEQAEQRAKAEVQQEFLETGPERLDTTEMDITDLSVAFVELMESM